MYLILAEAILIIHFAFVAFIVLGFVAIWIGHWLKKSFATNFCFRMAHVLAMGFVLLETLIGVICPLTAWEVKLRELAGQSDFYSGSFVSHWLGSLLYYDLPWTFFAILYALFFVLIVVTWFVVKPRKLSSNG